MFFRNLPVCFSLFILFSCTFLAFFIFHIVERKFLNGFVAGGSLLLHLLPSGEKVKGVCVCVNGERGEGGRPGREGNGDS